MTGQPYQFLPPLSDAEYDALRADIAANGMRHPIVVDERGKILDGHHRAKVAAELGFKPAREVVEGLSEQEKRDLAFTLNAARRHMDQAQRRTAVIASLKADPQLSDRQHGRRTGVSHPTVASIRAELVARGDVESLSTRVDSAGREQPATRQTPAPMPEPGPEASTSTGPGHDHPHPPARPAAQPEADGRLPRPGAGDPLPAGIAEQIQQRIAEKTRRDSELDDPEAIAAQQRQLSSENVAKGLVALHFALDTDPLRWLAQTWQPDAYRERDLPRVRDAFTASGLRSIAKNLDTIADHLDATGGSL
ncbi:hypothetical protein [Micromonospora chersina]